MSNKISVYAVLLIQLLVVSSCIDFPENTGGIDPDDETVNGIYFPSNTNQVWQKVDGESLQIDEVKMQELESWVQQKNGNAFIILHKGKIVTEKYWKGWNKNTFVPVTSISKSVVSVIAGMAQEQGYFNIDDKTSDHLGQG